MRLYRSTGYLAAVLALGASANAVLAETTPDIQSQLDALKNRVEAQDQEIRELRKTQGDDWMNQRRAEEVKALVREVLSDADTRASLTAKSVSAGHDKGGFFLASEDGKFRLNIGGQLQLRY